MSLDAATAPTAPVDYLDEDPQLRGQNYVCLSFLSPEEILANKEVYYVSQYLAQISAELQTMFQGLALRFPAEKDLLDSIRETNSHLFTGGSELQDSYRVFRTLNESRLESEFRAANGPATNVRGIKVRGVFDTVEEAKLRAEVLKRMGDKFDIYIGQVGCWCPWSPNPHDLQDQRYSENSLNELMRQYKDNMSLRDQLFEERKAAKIADAAAKVAAAAAAAPSSSGASAAPSSSGASTSALIDEGPDPWLAARSSAAAVPDPVDE